MKTKRVVFGVILAIVVMVVIAGGFFYPFGSKRASSFSWGTPNEQEKIGAPAGGYPEFVMPGEETERQAEQRKEFANSSTAKEDKNQTEFSAGVEEDPMLLEEWFWAQRAYPAGKIPLAAQDAVIHNELNKAGRAPSASAPYWVNLGPAPLQDITYSGQSQQNASGRAPAVAINPNNANTILVGAAQGGIWKTITGGASFSSVSENLPSLAIKVIRYAPSNTAIVYAGSGEPHGSTSIYGQGVFKSTNGGDTWQALPPNGAGWDFRYATISGLQVHPTNPNILYITTAAIHTSVDQFNPEQAPQTGIFKSTDGGQTWTMLKAAALYTSPTASTQGNIGFMDLEMAHSDPNLLYASEYFGGIWKSTNGGTNWDLVTPVKAGGGADFPAPVPNFSYFSANQATFYVLNRFGLSVSTPEFTRVEIALSQSNPSVLYAGYAALLLLDADSDGSYDPNIDIFTRAGLLFKSTDGGANWSWLGDWARNGVPDYCASQCGYDNAIEVSPTNANDLLIGGSANYNSLWPDPLTSPTRYLQLPWRGMVYRSLDGGATWVDTTPHCTSISPISTTTFNAKPVYPCSPNAASKVIHPDVHSLSYDPTGGAHIYVGNDGGFYRATFSGTGANSSDYTWENLNNGLSTLQFYYFDVHPTNANLFIGGLQDNSVAYWNGTTWEGWGFGDGIFGAFDPIDPQHIYMGTQFNIHRHDSGGAKNALDPASGWNLAIFKPQVGDSASFVTPFEIDPVSSATVYAASQMGLYRSDDRGDTWGGRVNGTALDGTPTTISVSPVNHNNVFVGTSNGWVYYFDYTAGLLNQRGSTLPPRYMTDVEASSVDASTLYVAFSGYNSNTPGNPGKVFKSTDLGITFTDISGDLPDMPVSALAVDPNNEQRIWVGTDVGIFETTNGGTTWTSLRGNMPVVAIMDLKYNPTTKYLTVVTHGRGAWRINPDAPQPHFTISLPLIMRQGQAVPPTATPTATSTSTATPTSTFTPPPPSTSTPTPTATPIFPVLQNPNFDLGHVAWTENSTFFQGSLLTLQGIGGAPAAHTGEWLAWMGGVDGETSDLNQQISIPNGIGPTYLNFYYQISSNETNCSTSTPSDAVYLFVDGAQVGGFVMCDTYNTGAVWTAFGFGQDLSAYAGQTVTLHIKVILDSALTSSFYLDTLTFDSIQHDTQPASARQLQLLPAVTPAPGGRTLPAARP